MPGIARVAAPGVEHQVTQHGNRGRPTFFSDEDYQLYLGLATGWMKARGVEVGASCLMLSHVQPIAVALVKVNSLSKRIPFPLAQFLNFSVAPGELLQWRQRQSTGSSLCGRVIANLRIRRAYCRLGAKK